MALVITNCNSFLGEKQFFFDGNDTTNHVCQCNNEGTCLGGCNCNHSGKAKDKGTITLKSILPIRQFNYGPLGMEGESAQISIGPLKCEGHSSGKVFQFNSEISYCAKTCFLDLWPTAYT